MQIAVYYHLLFNFLIQFVLFVLFVLLRFYVSIAQYIGIGIFFYSLM